MFGKKAFQKTFEHEVLLEMEFLQKLHGDDAAQIARAKAVRPENRTHRRQVLEEVARRLSGVEQSPKRSIFDRWLGA